MDIEVLKMALKEYEESEKTQKDKDMFMFFLKGWNYLNLEDWRERNG